MDLHMEVSYSYIFSHRLHWSIYLGHQQTLSLHWWFDGHPHRITSLRSGLASFLSSWIVFSRQPCTHSIGGLLGELMGRGSIFISSSDLALWSKWVANFISFVTPSNINRATSLRCWWVHVLDNSATALKRRGSCNQKRIALVKNHKCIKKTSGFRLLA